MKIYYACPTRSEVPKDFKRKTKVFGMGKENAKKLAKELEKISSELEGIIVYGTAGSLDPKLQPGDVFQISHLATPNGEIEIANSARVVLASVEKLASNPEIKRKLREQTHADLVDMEMFYLWQAAPKDIRERLIFIRGVIDHAEDNLEFIEDGEVLWTKLIQPKNLKNFFRLFKNWRIYLKSMNEFLLKFQNEAL